MRCSPFLSFLDISSPTVRSGPPPPLHERSCPMILSTHDSSLRRIVQHPRLGRRSCGESGAFRRGDVTLPLSPPTRFKSSFPYAAPCSSFDQRLPPGRNLPKILVDRPSFQSGYPGPTPFRPRRKSGAFLAFLFSVGSHHLPFSRRVRTDSSSPPSGFPKN